MFQYRRRFLNRRTFSSFTVDGRFSVPFKDGQTFLSAADSAGVVIAADCREGKCGKCEVDILIPDEARVPHRARACVEPAIAGVDVVRLSHQTPTYFQEKSWMKRQREEEHKRRTAIKAERETTQNTIDAMKERARKFEEVSGVSLKDDDDDEVEIDWSTSFQISEHSEVARRCLKKLRSFDPRELTVNKFKKVIKTVPGFKETGDTNDEEWEKALEVWKTKHQEEIDRVTYDNCASYEP
jgi:ferredoxin